MSKSKVSKVSSDVDKYDKKDPREHVLIRPDTYIGDIEPTQEELYIYNEEENLIKKKKITFTPGFLKVFDEALVNARDASCNDKTCDTIKIEYNKEEGYFSVWNNGDEGIPVEEHPIHKMYVPTMIFGELLSGSNFDDNKERTTGGKNGIGGKALNIFSTKFVVEVDDAKRGRRFIQTWTNNMFEKSEPKITKLPAKTKSSVKITSYPDFKRFGLTDLNNDHYGLFYRRAIDIGGTSPSTLKVYFNDKKINVTNFKNYIDLYYPTDKNELYFDSSDRWSVGVIYKQDCGSEVISFVNGISTYKGGSHCNHVIDNIVKTLINDYIKKKAKEIKIGPAQLKENLIFFINSIIINPAFSSQTKVELTTKVDKFGSKYEPTQTFLKKLAKCGIVEQVIELAKFKETSTLKKTDGKKQVRVTDIPKLDDAEKAGTKESYKCTLILTEGDSAKATAMAGLSVIGSKYYGVFPLKGKLLNVREASPAQILANEEITNLKKIIGLKQGTDYTNDDVFNELRYGHILTLTDQDVDGSHIKGLVMNMFHSLWPSLIKRENFIQSLNTPIVKAFKGSQEKVFYNLTDYEDWSNSSDSKGWKTKYYKGLGTSTSSEAKEYFIDIEDKLITYFWQDVDKEIKAKFSPKEESDSDNNEENDSWITKDDDDALKLAFEKARADDRKDWLMAYDKNRMLDYKDKIITYYDFIHSELIHFSNDDLNRSIPSVMDGLKPSQRKVLYGAFLRGLDKEEVKVAQLAGFVSDKAAYHHGEMSLQGAIIGMAQNFIGSNNIQVLKPNGQYGTRVQGGSDSASSRYIWTKLEDLTPLIFKPVDDCVLNKQFDDGTPVEPEYYAPIIPMILVNGAKGIGTGFSTTIPPYNPLEIIENVQRKLKGKSMKEMNPWYQGFEGIISKVDDFSYEVYGTWSVKDNKVIISELPIGTWTSNYCEFLERLLSGEKKEDKKDTKKKKEKEKELNPFLSYTKANTDTKVHFTLTFEDGYLQSVRNIEKILKLVSTFKISNMHLYGSEGHIKKYNTVHDIINDYYNVRLELYQKRKDMLLETLENQLELISWKVKFILMVIESKIVVNNKKRTEIEERLEKLKFSKLGSNQSYDYLLSMPIYNLTYEKIQELKKQENDKQTEYDLLKTKTCENIWYEELRELKIRYEKWHKTQQEEANKVVISKKKKAKKTKK